MPKGTALATREGLTGDERERTQREQRQWWALPQMSLIQEPRQMCRAWDDVCVFSKLAL